MVESPAFEVRKTLVLGLALLFASWVALNKLLNLSNYHLSHL